MTAIQPSMASQPSDSALGLHRAGLTAHRGPLPALTGLRFFAATYVILYHSRFSQFLLQHGMLAEGHFLGNGQYAVLLFFLLSGFILSYTYSGQLEKPGQRRRFLEARFSRIWPLYAVSLLASTLVEHTTPTAGKALTTLLMLQAWNPWDIQMAGVWNFVCWTLSVEAFFYLVFPPVQRWMERRRVAGQVTILVIAMLVSVVARTGAHTFGVAAVGPYRYVPLAILRLPDFVIGICLGNLYLHRLGSRGKPAEGDGRWGGHGPWTWTAIVVSIFLFCHAEGWWTACTPLSFALLLMGLASENSLPQRLLSSKTLLLGGQISYAMYLLQWPCKMGVNQLCDYAHLASADLRFVLGFVLLLSVSAAAFYGIEQPARQIVRSVFSQIERRRPLLIKK